MWTCRLLACCCAGISHFQLSRLLLLLGQKEEALESAVWAQREFPPVYQLTDMVSLALADNGRMEEAEQNYR